VDGSEDRCNCVTNESQLRQTERADDPLDIEHHFFGAIREGSLRSLISFYFSFQGVDRSALVNTGATEEDIRKLLASVEVVAAGANLGTNTSVTGSSVSSSSLFLFLFCCM